MKKKRSNLAARAVHRRRNQVVETGRKLRYRGLDSFKEQGLISPNRRLEIEMIPENSLQACPFTAADLVDRQLGKQSQYLKLPLQIFRVVPLIRHAHRNFPISNREHAPRIGRAGTRGRRTILSGRIPLQTRAKIGAATEGEQPQAVEEMNRMAASPCAFPAAGEPHHN